MRGSRVRLFGSFELRQMAPRRRKEEKRATTFSLADLISGQLDQINGYLHEGKLEAFLVRPLALMASW